MRCNQRREKRKYDERILIRYEWSFKSSAGDLSRTYRDRVERRRKQGCWIKTRAQRQKISTSRSGDIITISTRASHGLELIVANAGSGNYFRNLVTIGLQIIVTNCVCNYNLRANQLWVTIPPQGGAVERVVARERIRPRFNVFHLYWTRLSDAMHAMRRCGIWTGPYGLGVTRSILRESNPPTILRKPGKNNVDTHERFYDRAFRVIACAWTITGRYRPYARARVWHACSRVSFSKRLLRKRFHAALPSPKESVRASFSPAVSHVKYRRSRIMTYNTAGSFPIILIRRDALDRNCTVQPPFLLRS